MWCTRFNLLYITPNLSLSKMALSTASRSTSLAGCVTLCGARGGAPVCVQSLNESNALSQSLDGRRWLGNYLNGSASACVGGEGNYSVGQIEELLDQRVRGTITSPCDCKVVNMRPAEDQYMSKGEQLAVMAPMDSSAHVVANFPFNQGEKLEEGQQVMLAERVDLVPVLLKLGAFMAQVHLTFAVFEHLDEHFNLVAHSGLIVLINFV